MKVPALLSPLLAALFLALPCTGLSAQAPDSTWSGTLAFDAMGHAVANVGDCDGDGVDDIAMSAPNADQKLTFPFPFTATNVGHVQLRSGATGAVLFNRYGTEPNAEYGYSIDGVGDLDGNGRPDVLIGIPRADADFADSGAVQIRSGQTGQIIRTHSGPQIRSRFGHSVSGGGQFYSTGSVTDYAIGAPWFDMDDSVGGPGQEGTVVIYNGATGVLGGNIAAKFFGPDSEASPVDPLVVDMQHFGWSVAFDSVYLAVGAPLADERNTSTGAIKTDTGFATPAALELARARAAVSSDDRARYDLADALGVRAVARSGRAPDAEVSALFDEAELDSDTPLHVERIVAARERMAVLVEP